MSAGAGVIFWVTASLQNLLGFFPPSIMRVIHFQDLVNAVADFLVSITGNTLLRLCFGLREIQF